MKNDLRIESEPLIWAYLVLLEILAKCFVYEQKEDTVWIEIK